VESLFSAKKKLKPETDNKIWPRLYH